MFLKCVCRPWLLGTLVLGLGTYLYHSTLQTHATQLTTSARGTAVSLFAFSLFLGQAIGSALAGWAFDHFGPATMLLPAAVALPTIGVLLSAALRRRMQRPARVELDGVPSGPSAQ